ncbi:MAG: extracellular solute-binding protein [Spirochaetaceae bacterium]|nr:extracellular solute-binding protein [Spirochaetaceae bacterium]
MKKKIGGFVFCTVILLLAACGGSRSVSRASPSASKPVEIEFWYGLGGFLGETMESIIQTFNESQNEVHVTGVQQSSYSETAQQIQAAVAAKQVPATALFDIFTMNIFAENGVTEALDSRIAAAPDFNKGDIIPSFLSYCVNSKNQIMGLPAYGTTQVMYYRLDAFRDAGIDPERAFVNWESLAEAAAKMTRRENGKVVFYGWEPMGGSYCMVDIAFSNGARVVSEDGRTALLNTPEWIESWESVRRWIFEDQIMRIYWGGDGWEYWYKTIDDVMLGRAAGYVGSSGDQGDLDFSILAAHIQPGFGSHPPSPGAECQSLVVLSGASEEQKEAGFKWIRYFNSAEVTARFCMKTGYIPVRSSSMDTAEFKAYVADHPQALVPLKQAEIARKSFMDFTGGRINTAVQDACELVQIENVPAALALAEAQRTAQAALDEYWAEQGN